jgi:hypothetical protein
MYTLSSATYSSPCRQGIRNHHMRSTTSSKEMTYYLLPRVQAPSDEESILSPCVASEIVHPISLGIVSDMSIAINDERLT